MIQRIVLLKLEDPFTTAEVRAEVAAYSRRVLGALPQVAAVNVGTPADEAGAGDWDLSLVLHFASTDDLEPFREHPDHRAYVDEYLKPKLACLKAWNFLIP